MTQQPTQSRLSRSADHDDAAVSLLLPTQDVPADQALARAMSPSHFPIGPDGLRGAWSFDGIEEGSFAAGGFEVLNDAQHTVEEFPALRHYGHSTIDYAVSLSRAAGAGRLLAFHHAPTRTDVELDQLADRFASAAVFAREGDELDV